MPRVRWLACLLLAGFLSPAGQAASTVTFDHVKVRRNRSESDRRLVDKSADLTFDDSRRVLRVRCDGKGLEIAYDDVQKVVFDVSEHMRGTQFGLMGSLIGAVVSSKAAEEYVAVKDYWFYLEYQKPDGSSQPFLMEVYKEVSADVVKKAVEVFGERATMTVFPAGAEIDKKELKDLDSKHSMEPNLNRHPSPELKPDKALVVVVCPPPAARMADSGNQFKLHANDRVVAVNKMGTYSIVYLDPGKYRLASQAENAHAVDLELEAGKDYYFLQNVGMGNWKGKTRLSQHSKELVTFEMNGAWLAEWKAK